MIRKENESPCIHSTFAKSLPTDILSWWRNCLEKQKPEVIIIVWGSNGMKWKTKDKGEQEEWCDISKGFWCERCSRIQENERFGFSYSVPWTSNGCSHIVNCMHEGVSIESCYCYFTMGKKNPSIFHLTIQVFYKRRPTTPTSIPNKVHHVMRKTH